MTKKNASEKKHPDKRAYPRISVNMWVREERSDYYFLYKATDISEGGLFLEKKIDSPNPQVRSMFKFTLPKSSRLIEAEGGVVYTATSKQGNRVGSGVRFDQMSNHDRKLILKFIRQAQ